jgi:hypothetical protein
LDGTQAEDGENDFNADPLAVSSSAAGSNKASPNENVDMSSVDSDDDAAKENEESDNSNSISQLNDNSMERYFYNANMDGAMDAAEDYSSRMEVAESDTVALATRDEVKERDEQSILYHHPLYHGHHANSEWVEDDAGGYTGDAGSDDSTNHNKRLNASFFISHNDGGTDHYYESKDAIRDYISKVDDTERSAISSTTPPKSNMTLPLPSSVDLDYASSGKNANALDPAVEDKNRDTSSNSADVPVLPMLPGIFDFMGLAPEPRDLIYAQPGMTEDKLIGEDHWGGKLGRGSQVRVTITKPHVLLCLLSKEFSAEYIKACEDQEKLFVRTSQFVHMQGYMYRKLYSGAGFKQVNFLEFHMGD